MGSRDSGSTGSKGHNGFPPSLRERRSNAGFFQASGRQKGMSQGEQNKLRERLLRNASPSKATNFKCSPEFYAARVFVTSDRSSTDGQSWKPAVVFELWWKLYEKELTGKDRCTSQLEFLAAYGTIKRGFGEDPLSRALARAKQTTPPLEVRDLGDERLSLLARFCRALAEEDKRSERCFFLSCRDAGGAVGADAMTGYRLLGALCAVKVLEVAKPGTRGEHGKATYYRYLPPLEESADGK